MTMKTEVRYVAKRKNKNLYAHAVDIYLRDTDDLEVAIKSRSIIELMLRLGGHYRGYVPRKVTITTTLVKHRGELKWAKGEDVWDD